MEHNQHGGGQGRRQHFHRGRRGSDRRGPERRQPGSQQQQQPADEGRRGGEHVDVEQIMREIRSRVSQRHGVELSSQQIHDLAARRLEAILDVRTVDSSLLDALRKGAAPPTTPGSAKAGHSDSVYEPIDESALFASDNGFVRFLRALLKPIARLLFNLAPLVQAINAQAKAAADAAARDAEHERRQSEWNALQYELLVRMVRETSRISIEMESVAMRVESLAGKVDFNERRVRGIEGNVQQPQGHRPQPRPSEPVTSVGGNVDADAPNGEPGAAGADGQRRRRRRRRGRRGPGIDGTGAGAETSQQSPVSSAENQTGQGGQNEQPAPAVMELPAAEPPAPTMPAERPADEPAGDQ